MSLYEALLGLAVIVPLVRAEAPKQSTLVLRSAAFRHYVEAFNRNDVERTVNYIDNRSSWTWLEQNIPFFESSDKGLEEMYYFRWWVFRKHIKKTPEGFVITGFLPDVPWAGKWNTIGRSAAYHFREGRWLRDRRYLKDYAYFWFRKQGSPGRYSFGAADAIRAWSMATQDQQLGIDLLPDLVANYREWEKSNQDPNGLFWQADDPDGMETSVGGGGYRPSINSYMYGEAVALGWLAKEAVWGWPSKQSVEFGVKAAGLRELVEDQLWDQTLAFYKTLPRGENRQGGDVRELIGYLPWYYDLPKPGHEVAWTQLMDPKGFYAAYGPTMAERRDSQVGPSRPSAISQTLTALANLLNNYKQNYVAKKDYLQLLRIYARSHHLKQADIKMTPFIGEDLHPDTGEWLARNMLSKSSPDRDRGRDHNDSTFNDLIITGLIGLRPRIDQKVEVNPLVPDGAMDYFCLDGVRYHDWNLTILWDRTGQRYHKGTGLRVFADGREIGSAPALQWMTADLPQTNAGWKKYADNPVIGGGKIGMVFNVDVKLEQGKYRMWGSWKAKRSLALFESTDGIHWSEPEIALGPNPASGWEEDVNRPVVLIHGGLYHMWYTGQWHAAQADGRSWIGYATSKDGRAWKRMSDKPVLSPELPWEGVAVKTPHVIWDQETRLFRMWYSGGEQIEPDAIGYATSPDGLHWTKHPSNPIFRAIPDNLWEQVRVAAAQILRHGQWHYMFYIGYRDRGHAQIGMARSRDGITNWERYPGNPIIRLGQDSWDQDACYKPFALFDGKKWLLWYNGRRGSLERIGLVLHEGEDLGF